MSNKDWTDKLPGLLEGYTEAEPEGLWDAVRAGVAPKKRRIAAWWYAGGGILAAAAVIALFVLLRPVTPEPTIAVVPGDALAVVDEPVVDVVIPDTPADILDTPAVIPDTPAVIPGSSSFVIPDSSSPLIPGSDRESPATEESVIEETPVTEPVTEPETEDTPVVAPAKEEMADQVGHDEVIVRKPLPIKVQISLSTTGYMGQLAQSSSASVGLPTTPGMRPSAAPATKSNAGTGSGQAILMMLGRNKASTTDATHKQSARFALGVRIGLYGPWGVESGIVSSTLTSVFNSKAGDYSDITTREIRYLGIPLYASYNLYQTKRIGIMLNAGPMYEFSNKTTTVKQSFINNTWTGETTDKTLYEDSKWSMNLGAALQLRTGKHGALYVQPGFSYHFPDNSTLETFYTAHPAAFSITFGYNFLF